MQMRCCACAFIKFECTSHLRYYSSEFVHILPDHALFLNNLGSLKFCLGSLVISYFCPASGPKMHIFYHKFA